MALAAWPATISCWNLLHSVFPAKRSLRCQEAPPEMLQKVDEVRADLDRAAAKKNVELVNSGSEPPAGCSGGHVERHAGPL